MSGFRYSGGTEIAGLVVSVVPAGAKVDLWRIDTMWRASSTQRPGRRIVCFVVLEVVARGNLRALRTEVASGPVLFHVQPPSRVLDWVPSGRRSSSSARLMAM